MKKTLGKDILAGIVVFLVAVPLCLGIALASGKITDAGTFAVPASAGLIAGVIGGIVVALLSKSQTSVSGPAAGLAMTVGTYYAILGRFDALLLALVIAGAIQVVLGLARVGMISNYFPSSVIMGLLASIGILLIVKQIPHAVGYDKDYEGDFSFFQPDGYNTFTEFGHMMGAFNYGAILIAALSIGILLLWNYVKPLKNSMIPGPLVVVVLGILIQWVLEKYLPSLQLDPEHLVQMPVIRDAASMKSFFNFPDFSQIGNSRVWEAAAMIAGIASLETLLNLEAVDKLDPHKRRSPANRELLAQGAGNMLSGLIGGLPITSVVVRSTVGIQAGSQTKLAAVIHGFLLLVAILFLPVVMNLIPLASLAGILIMTGYKLTSTKVFVKIYKKGWGQFIPFVVTIVAILATDLAIGTGIGLVVGFFFILLTNLNNSFMVVEEKHYNSQVLRIVVPQIASFLNKASIRKKLDSIPAGSNVILDASKADYIDPDILELMKEYAEVTGTERGIKTTTLGFKEEYSLKDQIGHISVVTKELQNTLKPADVLTILKEGNERFLSGQALQRNYLQQISLTSGGQHPVGVVLSCIDSRTASEIIFDLGLGDVFSVRIAGNVVNPDIIASTELGVSSMGARLIVVLGHTHCGAIKAACGAGDSGHLSALLNKIREGVKPEDLRLAAANLGDVALTNKVALQNISHSIAAFRKGSPILDSLITEGKVGIIGALHDIETGEVRFGELITGTR